MDTENQLLEAHYRGNSTVPYGFHLGPCVQRVTWWKENQLVEENSTPKRYNIWYPSMAAKIQMMVVKRWLPRSQCPKNDSVADDTGQSRHSKRWYWTQAAAYTENQLVHYRGNSSPRFQQRAAAAAVDALCDLTTTTPLWLMDRGLTFQKCHCQGQIIVASSTQQPINAFEESTFLSDVSFEWVSQVLHNGNLIVSLCWSSIWIQSHLSCPKKEHFNSVLQRFS